MELRCCIGNAELKGKTKHHIIHHRYFGYIAARHFLKDNAALPPLYLVKELPVLVVANFKGGKGDLQWGRGALVEKVFN